MNDTIRARQTVTQIFDLDQINSVLDSIDIVGSMEEGFAAYSRGEVVVPPVGEMIFEEPPGEAHIKYGFIEKDEHFVIKIASGSYENYKLGLPTNSGLMLLFSQKTGQLLAILLDEGQLTGARTAAAGAVAAKHLAPSVVNRIGVIGAGDQGRRQLRQLGGIVDCRDVMVWGLSAEEVASYKRDIEPHDYRVETTLDAAQIGRSCNLIVTVTPSQQPLLQAADIQPGTHITTPPRSRSSTRRSSVLPTWWWPTASSNRARAVRSTEPRRRVRSIAPALSSSAP